MTTPPHSGDPLFPMSSPNDHDLAAALGRLRTAIAFPPTPDLASAVGRALRSASAPGPSPAGPSPVRPSPASPPKVPPSRPPVTPSRPPVTPSRPPVTPSPPLVILSGAKDLHGRGRLGPTSPPARRPTSWLARPRGLALAGLALLLLVGAALSLSGDLRSAIADRLGLPGIRVELIDETPTAMATPGPASSPPQAPTEQRPPSSPSPVGLTLLLGEQMSLAEAQAAIPYPIEVPTALGAPDEVYVRPVSEGSMVALLYRARPGLPAAAETGVGALLMQFPAGPDSADIAKKVLLGQGTLTEVSVDGEFGYWVTGASELVIISDPASSVVDDPGRPSANVLLWASGGITYRLETALPLPAALALAESLTAMDLGPPTP